MARCNTNVIQIVIQRNTNAVTYIIFSSYASSKVRDNVWKKDKTQKRRINWALGAEIGRFGA